MRDYILMTDSCCDMDPKLAEELELTVLPLTLNMGGQSFRLCKMDDILMDFLQGFPGIVDHTGFFYKIIH